MPRWPPWSRRGWSPTTGSRRLRTSPACRRRECSSTTARARAVGREAAGDAKARGTVGGRERPSASRSLAGIARATSTTSGAPSHEGRAQRHHARVDPHVWLDPVLAQRQVETIRAALAKADPANAERYATNARASGRSLRRARRAFASGLEQCARREIVVSHASFAYPAKRYRLTQVPVMGLAPESEPSPAPGRPSCAARRAQGPVHLLRDPGQPEAGRDPGAGGGRQDPRPESHRGADEGRPSGRQGLCRADGGESPEPPDGARVPMTPSSNSRTSATATTRCVLEDISLTVALGSSSASSGLTARARRPCSASCSAAPSDAGPGAALRPAAATFRDWRAPRATCRSAWFDAALP